jgi:hypothetical protein
MAIFPVALDTSLFPNPANQQRLFPNVNQMWVDRQSIQSGVGRVSTYQNDNHEVILSHSHERRISRRANIQKHNALDNWTNGLMGRSRR